MFHTTEAGAGPDYKSQVTLEVLKPGTGVVFLEDNRIFEGEIQQVQMDVTKDHNRTLFYTCSYRIKYRRLDAHGYTEATVPHQRVERTKAALLATL
jgi:hypothetical protein